MESYIALEMEFLTFITQIRAVYDSWLKQVGQTKLVSVSLSGTLADTLQEVGMCVCVCVCACVCVGSGMSSKSVVHVKGQVHTTYWLLQPHCTT